MRRKFGQRLFSHLNFTLPRTINGRRVRLPVLGGVKAGIRGELFLLDLFDALLPALEGAVLDVGANIGQTLVKVKLADPDRRYCGFEPNAACFHYLEKLVRANDWGDVKLFPFGLSHRTSILKLHTFSEMTTDPTASFLPDSRPELVSTRSRHAAVFEYAAIDELIGGEIALVKIDVEGAELEVIRGMAAAIERDRPVVVVELMPMPALADRHRQTVELLQSFGYVVFLIRQGPKHRWAGLERLSSYEFVADPARSDFLALPASSVDLLAGLLNGRQYGPE